MNNVRNKGFTLIEVMIVIAILGIIGTLAGRQFLGFTESAKASAIYEIVNQINNEVEALGELHGVGPSVARAGIVKTGNSYLDVLSHGESFVSSTYANRYKYSPHSQIRGLNTLKMPTDGVAGEYEVQGMKISLGTSTDKNDYIFENVDGVVLANYLAKYEKTETFLEGQSGGVNGGIEWKYDAGLYEMTLTRKFN